MDLRQMLFRCYTFLKYYINFQRVNLPIELY